MATSFTNEIWKERAWQAISAVIVKNCDCNEFSAGKDGYASYLKKRIDDIAYPHTYEEYLESIMTMLHREAETLERAKLSVRSLRFSKHLG